MGRKSTEIRIQISLVAMRIKLQAYTHWLRKANRYLITITTDLGRLWTRSFIFSTKSCLDSNSVNKEKYTITMLLHSEFI